MRPLDTFVPEFTRRADTLYRGEWAWLMVCKHNHGAQVRQAAGTALFLITLAWPGLCAEGDPGATSQETRVAPTSPPRTTFFDVLRSGGQGPEMVVIPSGRFRMGCVSGRNCADNEKPVHDVQVESFALSKYEVTFEEYDRFTGAAGRDSPGDEGWGRGRRPVLNVSWDDAVAYTEWLSVETGERYRLPSEAEWEYAARAGATTSYSWGKKFEKNRANCKGCGGQWDNRRTAPVGSFGANPWGLHDLHGNIWEWVQDCWHSNYQGAPSDGAAWIKSGCSRRVLRGGAWNDIPWYLRAAVRYWFTSGYRGNNGFRVARTLTLVSPLDHGSE